MENLLISNTFNIINSYSDFDDQADMCEIVRALIAGGVIEGVRLDQLAEDSFNQLDCPGEEGTSKDRL
jgi:hypothetical protein